MGGALQPIARPRSQCAVAAALAPMRRRLQPVREIARQKHLQNADLAAKKFFPVWRRTPFPHWLLLCLYARAANQKRRLFEDLF